MYRKLPPKNFIIGKNFNYLHKKGINCHTNNFVTQIIVPNITPWRKRFCMSLMVCIVHYIVYMTKLSCSRGWKIMENVPARAKMIVRLYRLQPARRTECIWRLPKSNLVLAQRAMRLVLLVVYPQCNDCSALPPVRNNCDFIMQVCYLNVLLITTGTVWTETK
jgi:hypothetical protein